MADAEAEAEAEAENARRRGGLEDDREGDDGEEERDTGHVGVDGIAPHQGEVHHSRGGYHQEGRESMVDLEGPQQQRRRQWGEAESLEVHHR